MNKLKKFMHDFKWSLMVGPYKKFIKPNSNILDVGSGEAYISSLMQNYFNSKVIGLDVIDYNTNLIECKIVKDNKISFPDKSFDVVTFNDVLHHIDVDGQKKILKEANRVGKNILIFEDAKNFISYLLDILTNRPSMPKAMSHKNVKEWMVFLRDLGFEVTYHRVKRPFYYPIKHYIFFVKSI